MSINKKISNFAANRQSFSRRELMENFAHLSEKTLSQQLYRLVKNNSLERIKQGVYRLSVLSYPVSDEIKEINALLKSKFQFTNFCIWNSDFLLPFMHHVPNLNFIYVGVEKDASESVFNFLIENQNKRVFYRPDEEEYNRYITGTAAIIVSQLISESPLQNFEDVTIPTLEKILVDIAGDVEFQFLQGHEMTYFYQDVIQHNNINKKKLLRYASRRGRRQKVEQLYNQAL